MKWKITFYSEKVELETLKFPAGILANFLHIAEMIEDLGPKLGKPYVGRLDSGLYEIRAKGKAKEIGILHSFIKKSQNTPKKELDLSKKRMEEVLR